jgi:hypothetical protein
MGKGVEEDMRVAAAGVVVWLAEKPVDALLTQTVPVTVGVLAACVAVLARLVVEVARWDRTPSE